MRPLNLHTISQPPAKRRSVSALGAAREYPKLFVMDEPPPVGELLMLTRRKMPAMAFIIKNAEEVGQVLNLPVQFRSMTATTPFGEFRAMEGVLITTVAEEIALYQELIIQLASEEYINPERTAKKYDQITKLVALANGGATAGERDACLKRAISMSKNLISEERQV